MRVQPVRLRLLLITPVRIALGLAAFAVASTGNARPESVALGFAVGAVFLAFAALNDRRSLFLRKRREPGRLPGDVEVDPPWRIAFDAMFPSTAGVTVLAVVAFALGNEVLAAVLGGAVAGMGIASGLSLYPLVTWEHEHGGRLYSAPEAHGYFVG
jgi:hypothetical protein